MSLENVFFSFCAKNSNGITDKDFISANPKVSPADLVVAINSLVAKVCTGGITALEGDERIVYQCIKASDNKGIWTKDLKTRTTLHQTIITKVLRVLESRKIIKSVKSVKNSTRKVYMLAHLEPSAEITGGPWFSENELDTEFIEEMCKICHRQGHILPADYAGYPGVEQVLDFIRESKVTPAELTVEDISMLLDRLIYDGLIEKIVSLAPTRSRIISDDEDDNVYVYKAIKSSATQSMIGSLPCGTCPVFDQCCDFGPVTPSKCKYYTEWLSY